MSLIRQQPETELKFKCLVGLINSGAQASYRYWQNDNCFGPSSVPWALVVEQQIIFPHWIHVHFVTDGRSVVRVTASSGSDKLYAPCGPWPQWRVTGELRRAVIATFGAAA